MQDARNDQLFGPVRFCSWDCFWQSAHLSFSFAHPAIAQFHCFDVQLETSSIMADIDDEGWGPLETSSTLGDVDGEGTDCDAPSSAPRFVPCAGAAIGKLTMTKVATARIFIFTIAGSYMTRPTMIRPNVIAQVTQM
jgi:hypothetical protein